MNDNFIYNIIIFTFISLIIISCVNSGYDGYKEGSYKIKKIKKSDTSANYINIEGYTLLLKDDTLPASRITINNKYSLYSDLNGFFKVKLNPDSCYQFHVSNLGENRFNVETETLCFERNEDIIIDFYLSYWWNY